MANPDKSTDTNVDLSQDYDFFEELDKQVNGAVFDENVVEGKAETAVEEDGKGQHDKSVEDLEKELKALRKSYSDSSREAHRLYEENKEFKAYTDYLPILKALQQDPNLVAQFQNYYENPNVPIKDQLGLSDDTVLDFDEAVKDPNSDSAKVLDHILEQRVNSRMAQQNAVAAREKEMDIGLASLKEKYGMTQEQVNELIDYAKGHKLSYEDIYLLKNRENMQKEVTEKALHEQAQQLEKMRRKSKSMGSVNSAVVPPTSEEEEVFKMIQGATHSAGFFDE